MGMTLNSFPPWSRGVLRDIGKYRLTTSPIRRCPTGKKRKRKEEHWRPTPKLKDSAPGLLALYAGMRKGNPIYENRPFSFFPFLPYPWLVMVVVTDGGVSSRSPSR